MIKRIVDISEQAYLHLNKKQLLVEKQGELVSSIPVEDLGVLILQHPAIVVTQAALIACQQNNAVVVFCDQRHLPYSVLLPISEGNSLHTRVLREQTEVSAPVKKRLWKQIVQEKIRQQVATLVSSGKDSQRLRRMVEKVKSGDIENHEAQSAQHYWRKLMGDHFRRNRNEPGINTLLNYGYAIIRAMIARALVGSGLHPALGLHHRNQYNGLCLADDLMEPFRPWVDQVVVQLSSETNQPDIDRNSKQALLSLIGHPVEWNNKSMPLIIASHHLAANLKSVMTGEGNKILNFPQRAS